MHYRQDRSAWLETFSSRYENCDADAQSVGTERSSGHGRGRPYLYIRVRSSRRPAVC